MSFLSTIGKVALPVGIGIAQVGCPTVSKTATQEVSPQVPAAAIIEDMYGDKFQIPGGGAYFAYTDMIGATLDARHERAVDGGTLFTFFNCYFVNLPPTIDANTGLVHEPQLTPGSFGEYEGIQLPSSGQIKCLLAATEYLELPVLQPTPTLAAPEPQPRTFP